MGQVSKAQMNELQCALLPCTPGLPARTRTMGSIISLISARMMRTQIKKPKQPLATADSRVRAVLG